MPLCGRIWFQIGPIFYRAEGFWSVWGISEPCNASIQSSRCWETFPTIKSILRIHAAIKPFPTQVPIKLLLNSKSFQPHSCPMCLYECKRKSEYSIRLNSRSLACLPGPQLYGKTPVWMLRVLRIHIWSGFSCHISSEIFLSQWLGNKNKTYFIGFLP